MVIKEFAIKIYLAEIQAGKVRKGFEECYKEAEEVLKFLSEKEKVWPATRTDLPTIIGLPKELKTR